LDSFTWRKNNMSVDQWTIAQGLADRLKRQRAKMSRATVMRFHIGSYEAARIRSEGPYTGDQAARGAGVAETEDGLIDRRALQIDILTSSGTQLSDRLRTSLSRHSPNVQIRTAPETAAKLAAARPPRPNDSQQNDQAHGQAIGRVNDDVDDGSFERPLTDERAKGANDESEPGAGKEFAHLETRKECEEVSTVEAGKVKASHIGPDADVVENSHRPGRELMKDDQYSSARVQRRPGREAKRMKSDDLFQETNVGLQGKVGYEECADTTRLKEPEDELNFLPAQRSNPGPRTALVSRKHDGLEAPQHTFLLEVERRFQVRQMRAGTSELSDSRMVCTLDGEANNSRCPRGRTQHPNPKPQTPNPKRTTGQGHRPSF
jgi:hypothetical protein